MRTKSTLLAAAAMFAAMSVSAMAQTASYTNVNSITNGGATPSSPLNETRSFVWGGPAFTIDSFSVTGTIHSTPAAAPTGNFLSDARLLVTRTTPVSTGTLILQTSGVNANGTNTFSALNQSAGVFAGMSGVATWQFEFFEAIGGDEVTTGDGVDNIFDNINITFNPFVVNPPPPSTPANLGGSVNGNLAAAQVRFYSFTLTSPQALSFDTEGTTLSGTNDTELFLYDSSGNLIGADDDDGTGNLSHLNSGPVINSDDELPATLPIGTYYLGIGGFDTVGANNFVISSTSTQTGNYIINGLNTVPEPTSLALIALTAGGLIARRRRSVR